MFVDVKSVSVKSKDKMVTLENCKVELQNTNPLARIAVFHTDEESVGNYHYFNFIRFGGFAPYGTIFHCYHEQDGICEVHVEQK